jgi:RNA polymerase sigma-70 factor (ECF subfamily)
LTPARRRAHLQEDEEPPSLSPAGPASEAGARLKDDLARIGGGDREALARLYQATSAKLFGVCLRISGERDLAEEALQETYVAVWTKAHQFDPARASPITWLATIARNKTVDRLRARPPAAAPLDEAEAEPDAAPSPSDVAEASDAYRRLARCLDELEPVHARAVRTAFYRGVTYEELARREAVPVGTMKSWIRRSLLNLRACLEP